MDWIEADVTKIRKFRHLTLAAAALAGTAFASSAAYANSAAVDYFRNRADRSAVPSVLSKDDRDFYRDLHAAIDREEWSRVQQMLASRGEGPLHQHAQGEYFLAPTSPKIELNDLQAWLNNGTSLPQSEQIGRLAIKRGAETLPSMPREQTMQRLPSMSKRIRPSTTNDGTMPGSVSTGIVDRIKNDDPVGAQTLLDGVDATLSPAARAEWRTRVAWSYYIENQDAASYRLAQLATQGSGPWVAEAWWTAGLAAWRLGDCEGAADAFQRTGGLATNAELSAAGYYWQARANLRCREPGKATEALRGAARNDETLYGMLAAEQLGTGLSQHHADADFTQQDWQQLRGVANVRVAVGLAEIGEDGLADEVLRHQARIGDAGQYEPLSRLARDLGLPSTQLWMSYNAPYGARPEPATRFPTPKWTPVGGWQVDPALVYAHALQESLFRATVVSPAGARGLMQIMPSAAKDHASPLGVRGTASDLNKPEVNLAFGQRHMQMLRDSRGTQGLLPKVMAAYNAGLSPITRWNTEINDQGDPLLWMESIPYWETRGYVNIVMRNYWMYERQAGGPSESRMALAQGMWPTFPGISGSEGVRMTSNGALLRGR
ncbi:MAG: lytic transglycosylase domain-containing protein [Sphingomonadaceae bacterium]